MTDSFHLLFLRALVSHWTKSCEIEPQESRLLLISNVCSPLKVSVSRLVCRAAGVNLNSLECSSYLLINSRYSWVSQMSHAIGGYSIRFSASIRINRGNEMGQFRASIQAKSSDPVTWDLASFTIDTSSKSLRVLECESTKWTNEHQVECKTKPTFTLQKPQLTDFVSWYHPRLINTSYVPWLQLA